MMTFARSEKSKLQQMLIRIDAYIVILKSSMRNSGIDTSAYADETEQRESLVINLESGAYPGKDLLSPKKNQQCNSNRQNLMKS